MTTVFIRLVLYAKMRAEFTFDHVSRFTGRNGEWLTPLG
jgi:hypothetical protein